MTSERPAFHLAFPVDDLDAARAFYGDVFGCREGRASPTWVDFEFFGHQITAHLVARAETQAARNDVDGDSVPVRHFGVILDWSDWQALRARLEERDTPFRIAPRIRFEGEVGEQATMFLDDPSGNVLEVKSFRDPARVFQRG